MKFKFNPEKSNLFLMIFMIIILIFNCIIWFIFEKYIHFAVFLILTIIVSHMYFATKYVLDNEHFITYLGFLKIKIKYKNIQKAEIVGSKVNVKLKYITLDIYSDDNEKFVEEINNKIKEK